MSKQARARFHDGEHPREEVLGSHRAGGMDYEAKWVTDEDLPIDRKLVRWSYMWICYDRNISFTNIAAYLGCTKSQVGYYFNRICYAPTKADREQAQYLIDSAITEITKARHALKHDDDDSVCTVLSLTGESPKRIKMAQDLLEGEYGTWEK